jgi:EAL domain-containing protein (putative c-di-GMP-specific phosphodiesterase class I)/CheY-like chemotaxis protein
MTAPEDSSDDLDPRSARVLVVEDEPAVQAVFLRALHEGGYQAEGASDGESARRLFGRKSYDVVVADINLPGLNGIGLLRAIRQVDLDVPVILVTGEPSLRSALQAIEYGALRYLPKPVNADVLLETVEKAARMRKLATLRRQLLAHVGDAARQVADKAGLEARFERALEMLTLVYQPIVDWQEQRVHGYEALVRSRETTMAKPLALLDAAERLDRLFVLGRAVRARCAREIEQAPPDALLFVNLHARELLDDSLIAPSSPLSSWAGRVVLEITEGARLEEIENVPHRVTRIRKLGYQVAIDDIGAGYAGLSSFALLQPDVVKLDMGLVRDVHLDETKHKLVGSMIRLCVDLGMRVIAEGVERSAERDALVQLGCRYFQGYLFARPAVAFPTPSFELRSVPPVR